MNQPGGAFGQSPEQQETGGGYVPPANPIQSSPSNQGQGLSNALPITQGLAQTPAQGSCSASPPGLLPFTQCEGRVSNCWSVGQPDVDCRNNALCCFDGCANVCQGGGSVSSVQPSSPARPAVVQQNRPQLQQTRPQPQQPQPQPARQPQQSRPKPRPQNTPARDPWPQSQPARPVTQTKPQRQQPRPRPSAQTQNQPKRPVVPAESKPFVMCPSAMKCVPRINCDLKGVMTNEVLSYSPQLEMLRVPLIPCVNREQGNQVDVCCRDPNYKDPWPNMNGGGAGTGGGGKRMKQKNQANKKFSGGGGKKKNQVKVVGGGGSTGNCSSNDNCPADTPVCSEYGYCQCASYTPGSPDCWMQGGNW